VDNSLLVARPGQKRNWELDRAVLWIPPAPEKLETLNFKSKDKPQSPYVPQIEYSKNPWCSIPIHFQLARIEQFLQLPHEAFGRSDDGNPNLRAWAFASSGESGLVGCWMPSTTPNLKAADVQVELKPAASC